jgi:hypothetical protein
MTVLETITTGTLGVVSSELADSVLFDTLTPSGEETPLMTYLKLLIQLSIGIATIIRLLRERHKRRNSSHDKEAADSTKN